ncbi:hypothetical protein M5D96_013694, partial [Drosophila gunungcola]
VLTFSANICTGKQNKEPSKAKPFNKNKNRLSRVLSLSQGLQVGGVRK